MADEAIDTSAGRTGGGKKRLVLIGGLVAAVLVAAAAGYFLLAPRSAGPDALGEVSAGYFYDLPAMTVNLSSQDDNPAFLKLAVTIEVADEAMITVIQPRMARVMDAFQVYLRELRRADLEGSAGIYRLKEELRRRINLAVHPAVVDSILFKEILVQ